MTEARFEDPAMAAVLDLIDTETRSAPQQVLIPGTVRSVERGGRAIVDLADGGSVTAPSQVGRVYPGDRVMVEFRKPRGVAVVGQIRTSMAETMHHRSATDVVVAAGETKTIALHPTGGFPVLALGTVTSIVTMQVVAAATGSFTATIEAEDQLEQVEEWRLLLEGPFRLPGTVQFFREFQTPDAIWEPSLSITNSGGSAGSLTVASFQVVHQFTPAR